MKIAGKRTIKELDVTCIFFSVPQTDGTVCTDRKE